MVCGKFVLLKRSSPAALFFRLDKSDTADGQHLPGLIKECIPLRLRHVSPKLGANEPCANQVDPDGRQFDGQGASQRFHGPTNSSSHHPSFLRTQADYTIGQNDGAGGFYLFRGIFRHRERTPKPRLKESPRIRKVNRGKFAEVQRFTGSWSRSPKSPGPAAFARPPKRSMWRNPH